MSYPSIPLNLMFDLNKDLKKKEKKDEQPSDNTSKRHPEAEHENVKTQSNVTPIHRSARIPQTPVRNGFNVDDEEHELGHHDELDMCLVYGGDVETEHSFTCYTNAGFETDRDDIRSQTGYLFMMNKGVVDLKSSKQRTTEMSSTKVEYITTSEATIEAI
ncbi:hypothetical protein Tco_0457765 [Tanacetum coccineum]